MAKKKWATQNAEKDVKQQEFIFSYLLLVGVQRWHNHFERQFGNFLQK